MRALVPVVRPCSHQHSALRGRAMIADEGVLDLTVDFVTIPSHKISICDPPRRDLSAKSDEELTLIVKSSIGGAIYGTLQHRSPGVCAKALSQITSHPAVKSSMQVSLTTVLWP